MFCSTIIPTIKRATLSRAIHSILEQQLDDDFEVIVVNDSGEEMPAYDWQDSPRVRVIHTNRRERSVARNTGAAVARGRYLHFLDDDDWMLPDAFRSFQELATTSQATWIFGSYMLVDSAGTFIDERYPDERGNCFVRFVAGEWLPLQASLIRAEPFFECGGFAPLESLLGGDEDVDLARQIALKHDIAGIAELVAVIRVGLDTSTTNFSNLVEQSRQSRERVLSKAGALSRLHDSANCRRTSQEYWHGRMVSSYLGSARWNVKQGRWFTAVSRGLSGTAATLMSGEHVVAGDFWRGVLKPHLPMGWLSSGS